MKKTTTTPKQPDFENTQIAFKHLSKTALWNAYLLFKSIGSNTLVSTGPKLVRFALALKLPIKGILRSTIFKQFCGGETIGECKPLMERMSKDGVGSILDYSVEGENSEESFDAAAVEIIDTIKFANSNKNLISVPFCVFKVTAVCDSKILEKKSSTQTLFPEEERAWEKAQERIFRICQQAASCAQRLFFDAEETWLQNAVDTLALKMMRQFNQESAIVFNTVQMYRKDRLQYLKKIVKAEESFLGFKVVRGAYMEKERARAVERQTVSPIQDSKENTDRDFDAAVDFLYQNRAKVSFCAGTHNELSTKKLVGLMLENEVSDKVFFAQLLGMSDNLTYNLLESGFQAAKYVPYGPVEKTLPYLFRRAEENTSVEGQLGRHWRLLKTLLLFGRKYPN